MEQAPSEPAYGLDGNAPVPCIRHEVPTHGIAYAYRYFDLDAVSFDELPYVAVLCAVLGKLGTARRSASELDTLISAPRARARCPRTSPIWRSSPSRS